MQPLFIRWGQRVAALLLTAVALACRTGGTPPEPEAAPAAVSQPAPILIAPEPEAVAKAPAPVQLPLLSEVPPLVTGFTASGPASCFPLSSQAQCIAAPTPLERACLRLNGELRRCDDCRSLCSKPPTGKTLHP